MELLTCWPEKYTRLESTNDLFWCRIHFHSSDLPLTCDNDEIVILIFYRQTHMEHGICFVATEATVATTLTVLHTLTFQCHYKLYSLTFHGDDNPNGGSDLGFFLSFFATILIICYFNLVQ